MWFLDGIIGFVIGVTVTLIINNNKSAVKTEVDKLEGETDKEKVL